MKVKVQDLNLTLGLELCYPPYPSVWWIPPDLRAVFLTHELEKHFPSMFESGTAPPISAALKSYEPQEVISAISENGSSVRGRLTQPFWPCMYPKGTKKQSPGPRTDRDPEEVGLIHGVEDDPAQSAVCVVKVLDPLVPAAGMQRLHGPLQCFGDDPDAIVGIPVELAGPHTGPLVVVFSLVLLWRLENKALGDTKLQPAGTSGTQCRELRLSRCPGSFCASSPWILTKTSYDRYYYHPHFTGEESHSGKWTCLVPQS